MQYPEIPKIGNSYLYDPCDTVEIKTPQSITEAKLQVERYDFLSQLFTDWFFQSSENPDFAPNQIWEFAGMVEVAKAMSTVYSIILDRMISLN